MQHIKLHVKNYIYIKKLNRIVMTDTILKSLFHAIHHHFG